MQCTLPCCSHVSVISLLRMIQHLHDIWPAVVLWWSLSIAQLQTGSHKESTKSTCIADVHDKMSVNTNKNAGVPNKPTMCIFHCKYKKFTQLPSMSLCPHACMLPKHPVKGFLFLCLLKMPANNARKSKRVLCLDASLTMLTLAWLLQL